MSKQIMIADGVTKELDKIRANCRDNCSYSTAIRKLLKLQPNELKILELNKRFAELGEWFSEMLDPLDTFRAIIIKYSNLDIKIKAENIEELNKRAVEILEWIVKDLGGQSKENVKHPNIRQDVRQHNSNPNGDSAVTDENLNSSVESKSVGSEGDSGEHDNEAISEAITEILEDDPNFFESEDEDHIFLIQSKLGEKDIEVDEKTIEDFLQKDRKVNGRRFN